MKHTGILLALTLLSAGAVNAAQDTDLEADETALQSAAIQEYQPDCIEMGTAMGLEADELDTYVENCAEDTQSEEYLSGEREYESN